MGLRVLLAAAVLPLLPACRPASDQATPATDEGPPVRRVVVQSVEEAVLRTIVELSGEVYPWAAVTVAAETSGRIVELVVEVGDRVQQGQMLARIDPNRAEAALAVARAEVDRCEVSLRQAERDLDRGSRLAATNDIAEGDLDRLALTRDTAAAQLEAARGNLGLSEQTVADTLINAPFSSTVAERFVELGTWISPGAPVVRLLDQRRLKVRAAASQRDRARLSPGLPVTVRAAALGDEVFSGSVRLLGQEAEASTGSFLVEAAVQAPKIAAEARLLPGMQARLAVDLGSHRALVIPRRALVTTADGDGVFVVQDGIARFRTPKIGKVREQLAEVLSGLSAGEVVVVVGQHVLSDPTPVQLLDAGSEDADSADLNGEQGAPGPGGGVGG